VSQLSNNVKGGHHERRSDADRPLGAGEAGQARTQHGGARCELFAEHGVGGVTTQQVADRADVAIDTLYLYASTKAELLIMAQNQKFAAAIDTGLAAAAVTARRGPLEGHRAHPHGGRVCVSRSRTDAPICTSSSLGILQALPTRGTRPLSPTRGRHRAPADTGRAHRRPRCGVTRARDHRDHPHQHHRHRLPAPQRRRRPQRHPRTSTGQLTSSSGRMAA
jgi:AcrR family transcriptional regulator